MFMSPKTPYHVGPPRRLGGYRPTRCDDISRALFGSSDASDSAAQVTSSDFSLPISSGLSKDRNRISASRIVPSPIGKFSRAEIGASHFTGAIDPGNHSWNDLMTVDFNSG